MLILRWASNWYESCVFESLRSGLDTRHSITTRKTAGLKIIAAHSCWGLDLSSPVIFDYVELVSVRLCVQIDMASLDMSGFEDALLKAISSPSVVSAISKELESFIELSIDLRVTKAEQRLEAKMKEQVKDKDREIAGLKKDLQTMSSELEDLKSYSFREDLIIKGVDIKHSYAERANPESASMEIPVTDQVLQFFEKDLDLKVPKEAVSTAHTLPQKSAPPTGSRRLPKTIVRFSNRDWRNRVYAARFRLQGKNCFVEEHLTTHAQTILAKARELKRARSLHSCFSRNCKPFVRLTPSGRAIHISSVEELVDLVGKGRQ